MKTVTLKDPKPMGDKDPKYGQTYWSYTHDSDIPVMFNLMEGQVGDGTVIDAETVELKTSSKGTEYHHLKKITIKNQQAITPTQKTMDEIILAKLDEILGLLKKDAPSLGDTWRQTTASEPTPLNTIPDNVVEDIGDEPINLDDIPF